MVNFLKIVVLVLLWCNVGAATEINFDCKPKAYGENNPIIYTSFKIQISLDTEKESSLFRGGSMSVYIEGYKNLKDKKSNSLFKKHGIAKPILYYDEDRIIYPISLSDKKTESDDSKIDYFGTSAPKKYLLTYSDDYKETVLLPTVESVVTGVGPTYPSQYYYGDTYWNLNCIELVYNNSVTITSIISGILKYCNKNSDLDHCFKSRLSELLNQYYKSNRKVFITAGKYQKTVVSFDAFTDANVILKIALGLAKNKCTLEQYLNCLIKKYNPL